MLHRMLEAGGLAPMQVLATLHGHFSNMLVLDGDDVSTERDAAAILGTAPFVAKKALEQSRRLGQHPDRRGHQPHRHGRPRRARRERNGPRGRVEILVARLARQTRPVRAARPRPAPAARPALGQRVSASGEENHQRWFSRSRTPYSRRP